VDFLRDLMATFLGGMIPEIEREMYTTTMMQQFTSKDLAMGQ
jgi:hypothetical protein